MALPSNWLCRILKGTAVPSPNYIRVQEENKCVRCSPRFKKDSQRTRSTVSVKVRNLTWWQVRSVPSSKPGPPTVSFLLEELLTVWKVSRLKAHMELLTELCSGPSAGLLECGAFIEEINSIVRAGSPYALQFFTSLSSPSTIASADKMGDFIVGGLNFTCDYLSYNWLQYVVGTMGLCSAGRSDASRTSPFNSLV